MKRYSRWTTKFPAVAFFVAAVAVSAAASEQLPIELPPAIYAVPGMETNIYFDNLVLVINPRNYVFDVDCVKGRNDAARWRFTPEDTDVGAYSWKICVRNSSNEVVAEGSTTLIVVPADAGTGQEITMLMIGDSLTDASIYPVALHELLRQPGNPQVIFLGSHYGRGRLQGTVPHEGYGGWKWETFRTRWTDDQRSPYRARSKFLTMEGGRPELDFKHYLDSHAQGRTPDFITIMLGTNDVFGASDADIDKIIEEVFSHADVLLGEFKRVNPEVKIGIALPIPPAASQDAFGASYRCGQTRWQYRRNQFQLVRRMREKFGNDERDGISLIPVFAGIDCENNFPMSSEKVNARNERTIMRQNNGVHPGPEGYRQIADVFYGWLKHQLLTGTEQ